MSWIADAHRQWHQVYPSAPWDCPLDCGAGENYEMEEEAAWEEAQAEERRTRREAARAEAIATGRTVKV